MENNITEKPSDLQSKVGMVANQESSKLRAIRDIQYLSIAAGYRRFFIV